MKFKAFAPAHISGFFEPFFEPNNLYRSGSRGAGINVTLGATSQIEVSSTGRNALTVYVNGKPSNAPVTKLAIQQLIQTANLHITVRTRLDLPQGQGFGMSAAGALSATYALAQALKIPREDALKSAHCAEIKLNTGLGDILAACFGGIEIRRQPGLPPWGVIEHIPGDYDIVLCVIGRKINTRKILTNKEHMESIISYGRYCTKKILEKPTIEELFNLSYLFTQKTKLASKKIHAAIDTARKHGLASMCMLGNSIFACGDTEKLCTSLAAYGKLYLCQVDQQGARYIS